MAHNRKLALGGVALTKARIPHKINVAAAHSVRDELEKELINVGYFDCAPFKWVGLIVRYGLVDEVKPHYQKIDQKDGELPLAIEIDVHRMLGVSQKEMAAVYRKATLIALIHVGERYDLPVERLRSMLAATRTDKITS